MAWDGSRLSGSARVCRRSWIVVSTLGDPQPHHSSGPCPIPQVVQGSARVDASQRLHVTLQCPADPPVGCLGFVVTAKEPGSVSHAYSIPAGERTTKRLGSDGLCRKPDGRVRVKIDVLDD